MLGRYALYDKIASGGMASVHIGRLLGPVGFARTVAIKRMHAQFAEDPEFVSMFLDEARLAARIRHPNVVPTLDVVALSGELFLVMEYVQGESLARLIRGAVSDGERIAPAMAASIMVGVLHGLHAAHEAKNDHGDPLDIVHRDVSPHNVLVGIDGVARVLDFGVAKAAGRIQTTREGQLKGKLAYMSPEQVRGTRGNVTRATDIYAASVVLWETLTCKRLFSGDNEAEILALVVQGNDVPPSRFAPGVPPVLDEVTMRGLSLDPSKRFATAREMARALEDALPPVVSSKIGDWVERIARQTLEERSARIAVIESDSSSHPVPAPPASPPSTSGVSRADATGIVTDDMILTQLSVGSVSAPRWQVVSQLRSRTGLAAATAGGLLVVLLLVWITLHRSTSPSATAAAADSASAPADPRGAPSVIAEETAPSSVASAAQPPAPPVRHAPAYVAPPPNKHTANCTPPWYIDKRGARLFKTECL